MVPAKTAATAAGRLSAFLLNTYRRRCHLRTAEAGAPALAHNEPITTIPDGRAPSDASRSHRGSSLASAASAHHLQVTEATTPTPAPSEPVTSVSDGRRLSTAGTPHQGADPTPTAITSISDGRPLSTAGTSHQGADPTPTAITSISDGRPLSTAGTSHQGADPAPTADPHRETRAGGSSASHFSVMPPHAADDATYGRKKGTRETRDADADKRDTNTENKNGNTTKKQDAGIINGVHSSSNTDRRRSWVFVRCAAFVCLPYANAGECIARHANTNAPGKLLVHFVYWFTISTFR